MATIQAGQLTYEHLGKSIKAAELTHAGTLTMITHVKSFGWVTITVDRNNINLSPTEEVEIND